MGGAELIAQERERQLNELNITVEQDVISNENWQLSYAASTLCKVMTLPGLLPPKNWDIAVWRKMLNKGYKERLVIAGALIAAELDRMQKLTGTK